MKRLAEILRSQRGFTVIEMLTVLMVIGVLSTLILVNTQVGNRRQELRDSAAEYVNGVRNVESRAAAAEAVNDPETGQATSRKAYGVCVTSTEANDGKDFPDSKCAPPGDNPDAYQIFARTLDDTSNNPALDQSPEAPMILQSVRLPDDFQFELPTESVGPSGTFFLDFVPPQPLLFVNGTVPDQPVDLRIFYVKTDGCNSGADCKTIRIRPKAGAVYVQ